MVFEVVKKMIQPLNLHFSIRNT